MKKYISLIMLLMMLFTMTVHAESADLQSLEFVTVDVYDTSSDTYYPESVPVVNLMLGKEDILTTDVPAFILGNRTLVPIRFIAESLDADINWDQEKRQAIIEKDGKEIILTIDSAYALVNGKQVTLPSEVPAKLVTYNGSARTLVPFRFVSEQLGMEIEWLEDTYTAVIDYPHASISDVTYTTYNGLPAIGIDADGRVNYNAMYLPAVKLGMTDQLVVDIPNADLENKDYLSEEVYENGILDYRASLYQVHPRDVVRVTVDLEMQSAYDIHYDQKTDTIYLTFTNKIKDINYQESSNAAVIKTSETPAYNVINNGDKVMVDILDGEIEDLDAETISLDNDVVEKMRYYQYDSDYSGYDKVTRVEFILKDDMTFSDNMYIDALNNDIVVYMSNNPMNQFNYEYESPTKSILSLDLDDESNNTVKKDDVNRIISINVDKDTIDLLDDATLEMYDNIIKYIDIDGESKKGHYLLNIKYDSDTTAKILEGNTVSNRVAIEFSGEEVNDTTNALYGNVLIVLDPGHGGKDSGAYVDGVAEKTLNLDTSLKLRDLLNEAGFKVVMTRSDDSYPGLYERAGLANALNADIFLSVHHNALPSKPSAQGVLTLYDGSAMASKTILAKTMQKAMVNGLNAKDMGLMNKPKYIVTRETNMASSLVELGFMTNDYERSLLVQDFYRQKCAQALFNGIKEYVDAQY